jgi:hypothetical protein
MDDSKKLPKMPLAGPPKDPSPESSSIIISEMITGLAPLRGGITSRRATKAFRPGPEQPSDAEFVPEFLSFGRTPGWPKIPDEPSSPKFSARDGYSPISRLQICKGHASEPSPDIVVEWLRERAKEMSREMDRLIAENPLKIEDLK